MGEREGWMDGLEVTERLEDRLPVWLADMLVVAVERVRV